MSEVKRYTPGYRDNYCDGGFEDCKEASDGELVSYKDYAALEERFNFKQNLTEQVVALQKQCDALAAENVAQASSIKALATLNNRLYQWTSRMSYNASYVGEPEGMVKGHIREMEKILDATGKDTQATDAYLNSVRADVIKQLHSDQKEWALVTWQYDSFDALKRAAVRHGDSELSGVIFMLDRIEGFAAQLRAGKDGE